MEKSSEQSTIVGEEKSASGGALRKRYLLRCCSCAGAFLFFVAIFAVSLIFTVFKVRGPDIWMNNSTVKLDLINGTTLPRPGSNATIKADVSVKNRNYASFRYPTSTSSIYYRGAAIGEATLPAGKMLARRTKRINVTVDIIMDRVMAQPDFGSDMKSGSVPMSWYTRVGGKAKFLMIKKHVTMKMNCTATANMTTLALAQFKCKPHFNLFN